MVVPHMNAIRHSGQMARRAIAISASCPRQIHGAVPMPHDAAILVPTACVPGWDLAGSRRSQVRHAPGGGGLQGLAANEVSKTDNREKSPRDGEVFDWITEVFRLQAVYFEPTRRSQPMFSACGRSARGLFERKDADRSQV
jgi:hypothetical protein